VPTYATQADLEAYVEGDLDAGLDVDALLERAERDVDALLVLPLRCPDGTVVLMDPGLTLKLDPVALPAGTRQALADAVCAQAEYRLAMGPAFFVKGQYAEVTGPEFQTKGKLPRIGPKVRAELRRGGMLNAGGHAVV
jgi:hypothetical protein